MNLVVDSDVAAWSAGYIKRKIVNFSPSSDRPFVLGLPTGSTPVDMYKHLIKFHQQGELSFRHVVTFNMDEYVGLPKDHPQSYYAYMQKHFFQHVDIPQQQVHMLDGMATSLAEECAQYEAKIQAVGGVDLFVGGLGQNGHIAFNEPGTSLRSQTHLSTLAHSTRLANARFFNHDLEQVPTQALTVGVGQGTRTKLDRRELWLRDGRDLTS